MEGPRATRRPGPDDPQGHTLRPATEADRAFLRRVHHEGMRPWIEATWGWDEAVQDRFADEWLDRADPQVVVVAGEDAGTLDVEEHDDHLRVANIVLLPRFQRRGLGTRIMQDVLARADRRGVPVRLQVLHVNPARGLYERLGFRMVDETPHHVRMLRPPSPVP